MSSLWTAFAVAVSALAVSVIASCSEREAEPPSSRSATQAEAGTVQITLEPPQGTPVDLQIQWAPFPTSEGWVEPMASLLHTALTGCGPVASQTDVALALQRGVLVAPPDAARSQGVSKCLYEQLRGKELKAIGPEARELIVRFAPASTKP